VYISNVAVQNSGGLTMSSVKLEPNPLANQVLRVLKKNTLIGLHLVASTEWDASAAELQDIKSKVIRMSHFLYNATDGQILIEQVNLADDFTRWENSDIRIFANRNLREYVDCPIGGFFGGSFFCNDSWIHVQIGSDGATYAHEFGHYGFNVDDEYSDDDDSVKCTHQLDAASGPFMNNGSAASCMMYWQILASKLCSTRPEIPTFTVQIRVTTVAGTTSLTNTRTTTTIRVGRCKVPRLARSFPASSTAPIRLCLSGNRTLMLKTTPAPISARHSSFSLPMATELPPLDMSLAAHHLRRQHSRRQNRWRR